VQRGVAEYLRNSAAPDLDARLPDTIVVSLTTSAPISLNSDYAER
jgi:hypothetical protein